MLLRRLGKYRSFSLDILAIFIGITASFWFEEIRSNRQREESLNEIIGEIRANLLTDQGRLSEMLARERECVAILSDFLAAPGPENRESLLNRDNCHLFHLRLVETQSGGYQRILNSAHSYDFDENLLALDNLYNVLQLFNVGSMKITEDIYRLAKVARERFHLREAFDFRGDEKLTMTFAEFDTLIEDPDFIALLYQLRMYRGYLVDAASNLSGSIQNFLGVIEKRWPEAELPIRSLCLQGDATEAGDSTVEGWDTPTPLYRNRRKPHLWQAVVNLNDGFVKFRGNDSWDLNWGAPRATASRVTKAWEGEYREPEAIFPRGKAEFGGLNIPVRAGRYRVIFNARTWEYRFDPVPQG